MFQQHTPLLHIAELKKDTSYETCKLPQQVGKPLSCASLCLAPLLISPVLSKSTR